MNDVINREDAIDAVLGIGHTAKLNDGDTVVRMSAVNYVLRSLPSAQPEPQWIPCSERLPQPNEEAADGFIKAYLVQDGRWMDVARWNGDCWIAWGYGTALINVTAWMPLPEPYAERREE